MFGYLKAQLTGDASRAIAGFPLSNVNYEQAIKRAYWLPEKPN